MQTTKQRYKEITQPRSPGSDKFTPSESGSIRARLRGVIAALFASYCLLLSPLSLAVDEGVGLYIGSFDPPTQAHREIVLRSALKANLRTIYISVNRGGKHSSKDYRWSLGERISMVRAMLRSASIRVVVLQEPMEGRVALAHHISELHPQPLRGIFGADTLEKDYEIFKVVPGFEYVAIRRPGYEIPELPKGTIVHSFDSPGNISSTEVRKKLSQGQRNIPELHPAVESFIYKNNPLAAPDKDAKSLFHRRYADFQEHFVRQLPELGIENLAEPEFNPHQTVEGQKEKIIRAVLPLSRDSDRWAVLTGAQKTLETYHRSYPLEDSRKAGFFLGSFDPISKGQIASINKAVELLDLDLVYFSPLEASRKPITHSILDRMAALEIIKAKVNVEARIVPSRSLQESVEVIDRVADRHAAGVVAVFGDNVFDANYARMSRVDGLEFAAFIFDKATASALPEGVVQIPTDSRIRGVYNEVTQLLLDRRKALPASAVQ